MTVTKSTRYALYAAAEMAMADEGLVTVAAVAKRYAIPEGALAKVLDNGQIGWKVGDDGDISGQPVLTKDGTIYIGATRGTVRRTEGMFAGATMEDTESDYDEEGERGPFGGVKSRIKESFHRTQEEARDMFDRVKRSFSDFINRE